MPSSPVLCAICAKPCNLETCKVTAKLNEEMDGIHFVNSLYWKRGGAVSAEARAEYQRRKDRLDAIRTELAQLRLP